MKRQIYVMITLDNMKSLSTADFNIKAFNEAVQTINECYGFQQIQDSSVALYRHAQEAPDQNGKRPLQESSRKVF